MLKGFIKTFIISGLILIYLTIGLCFGYHISKQNYFNGETPDSVLSIDIVINNVAGILWPITLPIHIEAESIINAKNKKAEEN